MHTGMAGRLRGEEEKRNVHLAQDKSGDEEGFDEIPAHRAANFRVPGAKCKDQVCLRLQLS